MRIPKTPSKIPPKTLRTLLEPTHDPIGASYNIPQDSIKNSLLHCDATGTLEPLQELV